MSKTELVEFMAERAEVLPWTETESHKSMGSFLKRKSKYDCRRS